MASKRRKDHLPMTDQRFETYHRVFDQLRMESQILNTEGQALNVHSLIDWDEHGVKSMLLELHLARLPIIKSKIDEVNRKFKRLNRDRINEGNRPLKEMPKALFEELQTLEASEDVALEEIEYLEMLLQKFSDKEQKESDERLLKYGPVGMCKLIGGVVAYADFQLCEMITTREGEQCLIISDKRSPYNGLSLGDYREYIIHPWARAKAKLDTEKTILQRKFAAQQREDEFPQEWAKIRADLFKSNPDWDNVFGLSFRGKSLPIWPANVENHLEDKS